MPPRLIVLNDDVLRHIADHLLGWDALSFSLTCKHVYDVAIYRVAARIECKDRDKLWSLRRTLFYDNPDRAKHIRTFIVRGSIFPPEELYGSDEEQQDDREVLESPVAPLVVELLRVASNILHLTIECFNTLQASDPGVMAAMAALSRLSRLELFGIRWDPLDFDEEPLDETQPGVLRCLRAGGWALTTLSLELPHQHDFQLYPALLSSIAAFPRLVTLRIIGFYPRQSILPLHNKSMDPSFPSVQKLFLTDTTLSSFDLVRRCPNASLVSICIAEWQDGSYENATSSALGSRWNRLHSLILSSEASMYATAQTLSDTAFHLEVSCPVRIVLMPDGSDTLGVIFLLDTLKKVSPVWAQLSVAVGMDPGPNSLFVTELAAPRLRFLELKIHLDMIDALYKKHFADCCWLDGIWDLLCSLPLVCLRLHLAKIPQRVHLGTDGRYGPIYHDVPPEDVKRIYNIGASMRRELPLRCANAVPTLKYIAVADEGSSLDDELNPDEMGSGSVIGRDWESADERYGGGADGYEYQSEWYAEKIKTLQWWRVEAGVVRSGQRTETTLRPLTVAQGKEVQRFLEEATDPEFMERIDEFLP